MSTDTTGNLARKRGPRSAEERVKGLLLMLPWLVQQGGPVELQAMADHFGMSVANLIKDLELATLCGRPPYSPADYIELIIDEDTVVATIPRFIEHAQRLTLAEGVAVLTALKSLQNVQGGTSSAPLNTLLDKLEKVLAPQLEALDVDLANPEHLETLRRAKDASESVLIDYFSPSRAEVSTREITPEQIFADRGRWYVRGHDSKANEERTFRVDRIEMAKRTGRAGRVLKSITSAGRFFGVGNDTLTKTTIDLKRDAEWILDNYPLESIETNADGTKRVTLYVTSEHWLGRLLVRLGPDATVVSPRKWQGLGRDTAKAVLKRYQ